ncbi:MFS multidrug resistance transporter [Zalerion maritima]|uniref:MFS multidrug resistance transporter n=1 Tax=Zalerion maritima TaxID=339359 RepID=A0AAD5RKA3_9PEZI|nr:MFS multidrug resistance transporter [Zalerion maritima]
MPPDPEKTEASSSQQWKVDKNQATTKLGDDSYASSNTSIHEPDQDTPVPTNPSLGEKSHRISRQQTTDGTPGSPTEGNDIDEPQPVLDEDPEAGNRARRGLFGRFGIIPEVQNPYEYPNKTKWALTLIVALAGAGAPSADRYAHIGRTFDIAAMSDIVEDLKTTNTVANLSVAFYMLSMSIFPLWWSAFSEHLGRRTVYIISFALFVVFSVLSAVSNSIAMFIAMRVLGGGAAASVQAVGAGTIADIFEVHERGQAMGIFYLGPLLGPLLAPIIGGGLTEGFGWQSTMWFLSIYGAAVWVMIFFCLPETLARKAQETRVADNNGLARTASRATSISCKTKQTGVVLRKYFIEPLNILTYLRFPPILLTVSYSALTFGSLFVLNVSIQLAFSSPPYNYGAIVVGLLYLAPSLGYASASIFGGRWIDHIMHRAAQKANRRDPVTGKWIYLPEDRMRENAYLSATLFPAGLVVYGWTVQNGLHWAICSAATLCFGFGAMLVFGAATTMLTEFMPKRSSGGVAINNFVRNIFSCVGAVVGEPMISAMGHGWSLTLFALVAWIGGNACIWSLRRFGPKWRRELGEKMG